MDDERDDLEVPFELNGVDRIVSVPTDETLLQTLRGSEGLTSVRGACGIGVCGSCTVLVDGRAVSSCIMLTAQAASRRVTTSEGLGGADGVLSRVQQAFVDRGAYQCSFCIPAMVLTVHAALEADPERGVDEIRHDLAGNLCRCGTYPQVLEAVMDLVSGKNGLDTP